MAVKYTKQSELLPSGKDPVRREGKQGPPRPHTHIGLRITGQPLTAEGTGQGAPRRENFGTEQRIIREHQRQQQVLALEAIARRDEQEQRRMQQQSKKRNKP